MHYFTSEALCLLCLVLTFPVTKSFQLHSSRTLTSVPTFLKMSQLEGIEFDESNIKPDPDILTELSRILSPVVKAPLSIYLKSDEHLRESSTKNVVDTAEGPLICVFKDKHILVFDKPAGKLNNTHFFFLIHVSKY